MWLERGKDGCSRIALGKRRSHAAAAGGVLPVLAAIILRSCASSSATALAHRTSLRSPNMCGKLSGKAGAACRQGSRQGRHVG